MAASTFTNGSTQPPASDFVTLISCDDFEFHISRSAACVSGTLRRMLDPASNFAESTTGICRLQDLDGRVLQKVVEYLYFNEKHRHSVDVADPEIPSELCLELLMAAEYLDC